MKKFMDCVKRKRTSMIQNPDGRIDDLCRILAREQEEEEDDDDLQFTV